MEGWGLPFPIFWGSTVMAQLTVINCVALQVAKAAGLLPEPAKRMYLSEGLFGVHSIVRGKEIRYVPNTYLLAVFFFEVGYSS